MVGDSSFYLYIFRTNIFIPPCPWHQWARSPSSKAPSPRQVYLHFPILFVTVPIQSPCMLSPFLQGQMKTALPFGPSPEVWDLPIIPSVEFQDSSSSILIKFHKKHSLSYLFLDNREGLLYCVRKNTRAFNLYIIPNAHRKESQVSKWADAGTGQLFNLHLWSQVWVGAFTMWWSDRFFPRTQKIHRWGGDNDLTLFYLLFSTLQVPHDCQ